MLCALIMAGGKGTRFWPLSTEEKPKQFLNLVGKETMIQMTVNRIKPIIPIERIFICTGQQYVGLVKEQLPDILDRNIIIEPEGRNTAPCIALSSMVIDKYYKGSNMIVLPSDHLISNEEIFREIVEVADDFINEKSNSIVTLGMAPSRAETGYGYINYDRKSDVNINSDVVKVKAFVEKPNIDKANEYLNSGDYLWNGGMFLWKAESIVEKIKKYIPNTYEALQGIEDSDEKYLQQIIDENYYKTDSISIDYAVLEKDRDIFVIPCEFGWDDVGSWNALDRYRDKDHNGNILLGKSIQFDSLNNIVVSKDKKIIVSNIQDIYVLESDTSIVIGKKSEIDQVKNIKKIVNL